MSLRRCRSAVNGASPHALAHLPMVRGVNARMAGNRDQLKTLAISLGTTTCVFVRRYSRSTLADWRSRAHSSADLRDYECQASSTGRMRQKDMRGRQNRIKFAIVRPEFLAPRKFGRFSPARGFAMFSLLVLRGLACQDSCARNLSRSKERMKRPAGASVNSSDEREIWFAAAVLRMESIRTAVLKPILTGRPKTGCGAAARQSMAGRMR